MAVYVAMKALLYIKPNIDGVDDTFRDKRVEHPETLASAFGGYILLPAHSHLHMVRTW